MNRSHLLTRLLLCWYTTYVLQLNHVDIDFISTFIQIRPSSQTILHLCNNIGFLYTTLTNIQNRNHDNIIEQYGFTCLFYFLCFVIIPRDIPRDMQEVFRIIMLCLNLLLGTPVILTDERYKCCNRGVISLYLCVILSETPHNFVLRASDIRQLLYTETKVIALKSRGIDTAFILFRN